MPPIRQEDMHCRFFFMVVKTNIDYQIVAIFVTENETEDSIQEALSYR